MIAADDEVRRPHILAEDRVQHRLARAGVEHVETIAGDHYCIGWEVVLHHGANASIAHWRWDVAFFELTEQHVNNDAIRPEALLRHAAELLMRSVHGVASLESYHFVPAALADLLADLRCGTEGVGKV